MLEMDEFGLIPILTWLHKTMILWDVVILFILRVELKQAKHMIICLLTMYYSES